MSDLRSVFTSRDFIINSNIVKCISKIDITLKEFLLVIYFINISSYLNNDDITNKLLDNMIDLLHQLEIDYPKNIKIIDKEE